MRDWSLGGVVLGGVGGLIVLLFVVFLVLSIVFGIEVFDTEVLSGGDGCREGFAVV